MLIGLDFDNTIVCYDRLFHRLAVERDYIPEALPIRKQSVRDFMRRAGREDDWTELQGIAYGPRITDAEPFPGVKQFLTCCRLAGVRVAIVSHKSRLPFRGEQYDLHAAAHKFLETHGFYRTSDTGLSRDDVFFEPTLPKKLHRIGMLGCSAFVDDLPELLAEPAFPSGVQKVLFDPADVHPDGSGYTRVSTWQACVDVLLAERETFV